MTRRPSSTRALALTAVLLLSACGVAANDEPTVIASGDLPRDLVEASSTSTSTTALTPTSTSVLVYFLQQQEGTTRLVPVAREVKDAQRPRDRLAALLLPPTPDEQAFGLLTSIPADTVLLDTEVLDAEGELVVDLSRSLFDVQGAELRNAFAQLVWTATELDGIRRVRFLVDGEEFRAPDEEGIEQPGAVARSDYASLAP